MLENYKKSIKTIVYFFVALFISLSPLDASFLSAEDLAKSRKGLSKPLDRLPEVPRQRPNLAGIVTVADIIHFRQRANKVVAGSSSAQTTEGVTRKHADLFSEIKKTDGVGALLAVSKRVHEVDGSLIFWGKIFAEQISSATIPHRRDQYIARNLTHLKTVGHRESTEEKNYDITSEDLIRVEAEISFAGGLLLYIEGLRQKSTAIASRLNAQKITLFAHQKKASAFLASIQGYFEKRQVLKMAYTDDYKGGVWDQAILVTYAQDLTVSMGELIRMGERLQSDEVVYDMGENIELDRWMVYWSSYVAGESPRNFLEKLESVDSLDDPYMVLLFKLLKLQGKTLREKVEENLAEFLSPKSLKHLMAQKNKVIIELKKRFEGEGSLAKQLLHPVKKMPYFTLSEVGKTLTDTVESGGASSSLPLSYQMLMDPKNTYVYDEKSGKYILVAPGVALSDVFKVQEKVAVEKGVFFNTYRTDQLFLGETLGYIYVHEDKSKKGGFITARGFNKLHILRESKEEYIILFYEGKLYQLRPQPESALQAPIASLIL